MKRVEIVGKNYYGEWTKKRVACRGVVIEDDKILLSYLRKIDSYSIPGGGIEDGESLEDCCVREILEETGKRVSIIKEFLVIHEFYEEWKYDSHYFICKVIGEGKSHLSKEEVAADLITRWISLDDAIKIFSKHQDYAPIDEMKRGGYLREYKALLEFLKEYKK